MGSIKQYCIADSIIEAKFVTACEAVIEAVWLRKFLGNLEVVPDMDKPLNFIVMIMVQWRTQRNQEAIRGENIL